MILSRQNNIWLLVWQATAFFSLYTASTIQQSISICIFYILLLSLLEPSQTAAWLECEYRRKKRMFFRYMYVRTYGGFREYVSLWLERPILWASHVVKCVSFVHAHKHTLTERFWVNSVHTQYTQYTHNRKWKSTGTHANGLHEQIT